LTLNRLHGVISPKIVFFINSPVKTSDPTSVQGVSKLLSNLKGSSLSLKRSTSKWTCTFHVYLQITIIYEQQFTGVHPEVTPDKLLGTWEEIYYGWNIFRATPGNHIEKYLCSRRKSFMCLPHFYVFGFYLALIYKSIYPLKFVKLLVKHPA
jgi:hypothetical protein